MPTHSLCVGFPLASVPSIVTFVLNGKAISYFTVVFRPIPRPRCDFFAFNFQVPSNALPKQSVPAASQTARATKVVLDFMAQIKTGIQIQVNPIFRHASGNQELNFELCLGEPLLQRGNSGCPFRAVVLSQRQVGCSWSLITGHWSLPLQPKVLLNMTANP